MTAQGGALCSAWLRAPPQNRRAIFPMCYGIQFTDNHNDTVDPTSYSILERIGPISGDPIVSLPSRAA